MGRYESFKVNKKGLEKIEQLRKAFQEVEDLFEDQEVQLAARERALSTTHLETACMYAIKAVALLNKEG